MAFWASPKVAALLSQAFVLAASCTRGFLSLKACSWKYAFARSLFRGFLFASSFG